MARRRFLSTVAIAALVTTLVAGPAQGDAVTDAQSKLDAALKELDVARGNAAAASSELSNGLEVLADVDARISSLVIGIAESKARATTLKDAARRRAVFEYTHAGAKLEVVLNADGAEQAARRTELLDHANQKDNLAVKQLAALNEDRAAQEVDLKKQRTQQVKVTDDLTAKSAEVQATLAKVSRSYDAVVVALELAKKQKADADRLAQAAAQLAGFGGGPISPGTVIVNPGGGSFMCPVAHAAYTDDYGGARQHWGNDLFVPIGTPAVAVKAGTVNFIPFEGAGGNTAYLTGNDGNVYFYAHLSQFVGGPRSVAQGEVIALSGMTGNASAPHVHFEIRVGGINGGRVDPYPTLRSSGC